MHAQLHGRRNCASALEFVIEIAVMLVRMTAKARIVLSPLQPATKHHPAS
jgi:hypothetical protein